MNKLKFAYLLLIIGSVLLVVNIYNLDFNQLKNENYWGIVSNLLLIIGMIVTIRDVKKN